MADLRVVPAALVVWVAALLNTGVSYASEKVILTCASTVTFPLGSDRRSADESLIIDWDRQTVTVAMRVFSITQMTENYVRFEGSSTGNSYKGGMDRVSGSGFVTWYRGSELRLTDVLTCKSAKQLF
jgi:hypothetical protein